MANTTRGVDEGGPAFRYTAALADRIETKWQARWEEAGVFRQPNPGEPGFHASRPKFYCLDMFPYPSGAGLHVGHPEGYTATDIVCRYMRMKGYNVLHPMGWDAFGLPAEQYAIQTGVHPAVTTKKAIDTFRRQLKRFGFSYDWSREFGTIDPEYYRWTQWVFLRLYGSWFDPQAESPAYPDGRRRRGAARPIAELVRQLEGGDLRVALDGTLVHIGAAAGNPLPGAEPAGTRRWHELSREERRAVIDGQRLAYLDEMSVNWCPALGTVLANDEVIDGRSERGGHPVLRKPLKQWQLRITAYADRLLEDLKLLDWPSSTRTMQEEWIGRSVGAEIDFEVAPVGSPPVPGGALAGSPGGSRRVASALGRVAGEFAGEGETCFQPVGFVARDPYPEGMYGPVADLVTSRRNLPHHRLAGATYFVTWGTAEGVELAEHERLWVLDALTHFDGERCRVYAAVVMSNHVHWIVRPLEGHDLDEVVTSVKSFTARRINQERGERGHVWEPECFDHIVRSVGRFNEFLAYVVRNPVAAGVVRRAEEYLAVYVHPEAVGVAAGTAGRGSQGTAGDRRGTQGVGGIDALRVFTTRPDTIFGATYMVVAPEHPLVKAAVGMGLGEGGGGALRAYVEAARNRSDVDRMMDAKEKTGVYTGIDCVNPATGARIPVWTADYVLMGYGTGAIMAVPAHDERDWAFARAYGLPIVPVVAKAGWGATPEAKLAGVPDGCFVGDGEAMNSANAEVSLDGLSTPQAKARIVEWLEKTGRGTAKVNYRLRDWVFSRQRYWGEPIPIVFDERGDHYPVSEGALPVRLPELEDYSPVESEEPRPLLAKAGAWVTTTAGEAGVSPDVLAPGTRVRRETNTMPGSAGSSWYFLRYCDPRNGERLASVEAERYWMGGGKAGGKAGGVDLYIGGPEHAVGHLLYARFWHKVLFDLGEVSGPEPFQRLFHQGMITSYAYQRADKSIVPMDEVREAEEGRWVVAATGEGVTPVVTKMSKRYKNVINPDDVIAEFGADTFRLYEMYMGPLEASKPWNTKDTVGCFRFLQRAWRLVVDEGTGALKLLDKADPDVEKQLHRVIAKVDADVPRLAFNTAIASLIELVNLATQRGGLTAGQLERFCLVLSPLAPHMAEELWSRLGRTEPLAWQAFPVADPAMLVDAEVEVPVQVNGKVRSKIVVAAGADRAALERAALEDPRVKEAVGVGSVKKVIVVPGKMVNVVV